MSGTVAPKIEELQDKLAELRSHRVIGELREKALDQSINVAHPDEHDDVTFARAERIFKFTHPLYAMILEEDLAKVTRA